LTVGGLAAREDQSRSSYVTVGCLTSLLGRNFEQASRLRSLPTDNAELHSRNWVLLAIAARLAHSSHVGCERELRSKWNYDRSTLLPPKLASCLIRVGFRVASANSKYRRSSQCALGWGTGRLIYAQSFRKIHVVALLSSVNNKQSEKKILYGFKICAQQSSIRALPTSITAG